MTPHIPNELYSEIVGHLFHPDHRLTLVSLALVNTTWRHESQRMLFRSPGADWLCTRELAHDMKAQAHKQFLEIVLEQPTRLGAYVYSYEQESVAVDPAERASQYI